MKVEFNHCYTPDPGHRFHTLLGRRGFTLHPNTVHHPGNHACRFISFRAPDLKTSVYLEFVSAPPRDSKRPGLSFSVRGSLEARCGTQLTFNPARRNAFRAAILGARDFRRFCRRARPDEVRDIGARLRNPAGFWDIVVTPMGRRA